MQELAEGDAADAYGLRGVQALIGNLRLPEFGVEVFPPSTRLDDEDYLFIFQDLKYDSPVSESDPEYGSLELLDSMRPWVMSQGLDRGNHLFSLRCAELV